MRVLGQSSPTLTVSVVDETFEHDAGKINSLKQAWSLNLAAGTATKRLIISFDPFGGALITFSDQSCKSSFLERN
jgi:hypothetical protein